jgi:NAD(P)-dependent dehydrogenase (short-subunit alcohol dehydrogenase family)
MSLANQTIVIIGASSGIGLATARAAVSQGARVVLVARNADKLEAAARDLGGQTVVATADMASSSAIRGAIDKAGTIDHLVVSAVTNELQGLAPLGKLEDENLERALDKLRGCFYAVRAAAPALRERGSITLVSGASAIRGMASMSILGAVNAAVTSFARGLAIELSPVRVNSVTPGVVDTPLHDAAASAKLRAFAESAQLPARRFGKPEDIADAIVFLMTNAYMTGHDLTIDGGLTAH